jgi:hypothetical protein
MARITNPRQRNLTLCWRRFAIGAKKDLQELLAFLIWKARITTGQIAQIATGQMARIANPRQRSARRTPLSRFPPLRQKSSPVNQIILSSIIKVSTFIPLINKVLNS